MEYLFFARLNLLIAYLQLSVGNLDEFLSYYETLHHDNFKHQIKRRDLYTKNPTERTVEFDAHGKHFKLMLHKNTSVLASDFKVTVVDSREKRSTEIIDTTIYKGYLDDEPTMSSVSAYWDDDQHFTATISTESDTFVVEPSWRHLPDSPDYTLISYKGSDMKQNEKSIEKFCGVVSHSMGHEKTSDAKERLYDEPKGRTKRNTDSPCPESLPKTCPVLLVADHRFYRDIGSSDLAKTTKYMIIVLDRVNHLYRTTKFGNCGDGFGFVIKHIYVHVNVTEDRGHYNSRRKWSDSTALLASFSARSNHVENYSDYCLVHLFTAVPFESNVLGVSEVAQATPDPTGGLCSGAPRGNQAPKNTGWTTFLSGNGRPVLSRQAQLVVAHGKFIDIIIIINTAVLYSTLQGHAWGSGHEFPNTSRTCNPSLNNGGHYLMYVFSVTGREPNNDDFSPCSIEAIRKVLIHKAKVCLKETVVSKQFCGNYVLEPGEQCDEGPGIGQPCCNGSCQLQPGKQCSDSDHSCCENCMIANASSFCRNPNVTSCSVTQTPYCNGHNLSCPIPATKPDGEPCEKQGICLNKTCISVCEYNNKTQCVCNSVELSCKICCRNSMNDNDTCEPYRMLNETMDYGNLSDYTPCLKGLCFNGVCMEVTDISLKRSWSFIEFQSIEHFVVFMKNNIVGTVIFLSLLLWIPASCAVSYIDRKRAKADQEGINWLRITNTLLVPQHEQSDMKIMKAPGTLERKQPNKQHYVKGRNYTN